MNIWGGSFRPDYAKLGVLRGRFLRNVPVLVASATLPEHVLDDIRGKLELQKDLKMVRLTNARPNIALSVRVMEHPDESKGDMRFLIPPNAKEPDDIPVTLVYCNQRLITEDCADRVVQDILDVPKLANLNAFCFLAAGNEIFWSIFEDITTMCALGLERKLAAFDAKERDKGGRGAVVEMVL